MPLPFPFDFKKPDYNMVFEWRLERYQRLLNKPSEVDALKLYYRDNIVDHINDWGCTSDPRNVEVGLPVTIPFILFPRQEEWVHWLLERWKRKEFGLCDKSREVGVSWLSVAVAVSICLYNREVIIGFGSRKAEYVDKLGDPKSILFKARRFTSLLPKEFTGNWDERKDSKLMNISYPETSSNIVGEAGDSIGRGNRTSIYIKDESAFYSRPEQIDAALAATSNCSIDLSTPCGNSNAFARKRFSYDSSKIFTFSWREDPRKDQAWYDAKVIEIGDPVIVAQELDLDYNASMERILIPHAYILSAIDAHKKLNIEVSGSRLLGFDVADEGRDKNALCGRYGILVEYLHEFSGVGSDIYASCETAFSICDTLEYDLIKYDADGMGASIRGDSRKINEKRKYKIAVTPVRGSGAVIDPEGDPFKRTGEKVKRDRGRTNKDYFLNAKAQNWYSLFRRFLLTHRAVTEKAEFNPSDIISISSEIAHLQKLIQELSQIIVNQDSSGKMIIDKAPNAKRSPNCADAVNIAFSINDRVQGGMFRG